MDIYRKCPVCSGTGIASNISGNTTVEGDCVICNGTGVIPFGHINDIDDKFTDILEKLNDIKEKLDTM